jgi:antiviral helicase SKI2
MVLNLLRIEALKVEDLMRRSFFEDDAQRDIPEKQKLLKHHEDELAKVPPLRCNVCSVDVEDYHQLNSEILTKGLEICEELFVRSAAAQKFMTPGRVILVDVPVCVLNFVKHTLIMPVP